MSLMGVVHPTRQLTDCRRYSAAEQASYLDQWPECQVCNTAGTHPLTAVSGHMRGKGPFSLDAETNLPVQDLATLSGNALTERKLQDIDRMRLLRAMFDDTEKAAIAAELGL